MSRRRPTSNLDRTNVKSFAVKHNAGDSNRCGTIDDSKSSIKLTATAVVVGKIQIVTVTETDAPDGVEAEDPESVTVTDLTAVEDRPCARYYN